MGHFDESINRYIWDADVIVYRLAGVYLMMAEIANMEGGDVASYINKYVSVLTVKIGTQPNMATPTVILQKTSWLSYMKR